MPLISLQCIKIHYPGWKKERFFFNLFHSAFIYWTRYNLYVFNSRVGWRRIKDISVRWMVNRTAWPNHDIGILHMFKAPKKKVHYIYNSSCNTFCIRVCVCMCWIMALRNIPNSGVMHITHTSSPLRGVKDNIQNGKTCFCLVENSDTSCVSVCVTMNLIIIHCKIGKFSFHTLIQLGFKIYETGK